MRQDREQGKRIAIERLKADSEARLKDMAATFSVQDWPYLLKEANIASAVAMEQQRLMAAIQTPAAVFRLDGSIDKRRYRRFVTRNRKTASMLRINH